MVLIKSRNYEIKKLLKSEDYSDAFNMKSSCKMHDDCFSLVCCLQGSYRALYSSAEVLGRFLHTCGMFWLVQHFFGSSGLLSRSLEVWAKIQTLWIIN